MPKPTFFNLPDDKRQRITDLAIEEFSSHPYRQASLSRVVSRAGIAKGSMYQYFENKLDLYEWLVVDELERRRQAWLEACPPAAGTGLFAELERRARSQLGFLLAHPRLARLAESAREPTIDPELRSLHARLRDAEIDELIAQLRAARERGEVRAELELRPLAHMLDALLRHGLAAAVLANGGLDLPALLAAPERAKDFDKSRCDEIVAQTLALVRLGVSSEAGANRDAGLSGLGPSLDWSPTVEAGDQPRS